MKIAQLAPLIERVPPSKYGGTERVVYELTEELIRRGHTVTLFASGDSRTRGRLISLLPKSLRELRMDFQETWKISHSAQCYTRYKEFDIIHDHSGFYGLPAAQTITTPVVITLHNALTPSCIYALRHFRRPYLVPISKAQLAVAPYLNHAGVVYNGLTMKNYPFQEKREPFLLYVGRISPEKGTHHAIEVAQKLSMPLVIAAKLDDRDIDYFHARIKSRLSDSIRWIGEITEKERNNLMSTALCMLHPVTWPEPFGLTLIEAMACGSPVIAFNKGSIPELISHGKTGFIVSNIKDMCSAVSRIDTINRQYCRERALTTYTAQRMADGYEEIYERILSDREEQMIARKHYGSEKLPF